MSLAVAASSVRSVRSSFAEHPCAKHFMSISCDRLIFLFKAGTCYMVLTALELAM